MTNNAAWFKKIWPTRRRMAAVLRGYQEFGRQYPETLADIALRAGLYDGAPPPNGDMAMWQAGRASLAKEILKLADSDARKLLGEFDNGLHQQPERRTPLHERSE